MTRSERRQVLARLHVICLRIPSLSQHCTLPPDQAHWAPGPQPPSHGLLRALGDSEALRNLVLRSHTPEWLSRQLPSAYLPFAHSTICKMFMEGPLGASPALGARRWTGQVDGSWPGPCRRQTVRQPPLASYCTGGQGANRCQPGGQGRSTDDRTFEPDLLRGGVGQLRGTGGRGCVRVSRVSVRSRCRPFRATVLRPRGKEALATSEAAVRHRGGEC